MSASELGSGHVRNDKRKGSSDDPANYRAIGLLNHACKILSIYLALGLQGGAEIASFYYGYCTTTSLSIKKTICGDMYRYC